MNERIYLRDDPHFIDNLCLSFRHDFGLLNDEEQQKVRFECKEWLRSLYNNAQRVCRCDDCRFNLIDDDRDTGYRTPYCAKEHWVGDDRQPYPMNWKDPWNNCKDYEENTRTNS
jgi:hypothetical protein